MAVERMAGDAIEERSAKDEGFRNSLERRLGTEEYDRISPSGSQALDDQGRMTAAEVIAEFRERGDDVKVDEGDNSMVAKYQGMVDSGTKFNAKAQDFLKGYGVDFGGPGTTTPEEETPDIDDTPAPIVSAPNPEPGNDPWPFPPGLGGGMPSPGNTQIQQVSQDNDIYNNISGNNNTVTNTQDNSISQSSGTRYLNDWMKKHQFFG